MEKGEVLRGKIYLHSSCCCRCPLPPGTRLGIKEGEHEAYIESTSMTTHIGLALSARLSGTALALAAPPPLPRMLRRPAPPSHLLRLRPARHCSTSDPWPSTFKAFQQ